ncbi:MAG: GHMP kinase [Candidatus Nealsonbacteria bacterium]
MIISQTPLRMSFVGGGTDFEDFYRQYPGRVLSTSINKCFYIMINSRFDGMIKLNYTQAETVENISQIRHPLIKAALEETGIEKGIDIVSLADLPAQRTGLGLGASSSFTVGLLNGLYAFLGNYAPPEILAEKACNIEIKKAGSPIGKQDQYAAAFGGLNVITFNCGGKIDVEPIYLSPKLKNDFQKHLLLFFTGKERSANNILSEQKQNIDKKFDFLKKMSDMVPLFRSALEKGEFQKLGELLHQNWLLKKELAFGVSNQQIEEMHNLAMAAGAWGGKILGAGGGGFFLVMASVETQPKVIEALKEYQLIPFRFSESGSMITFKN